jgi:hypothetical protein
MLAEKFGQIALEDGYAAFTEGLHLGFVVVHAGDAMAHLGKTD